MTHTVGGPLLFSALFILYSLADADVFACESTALIFNLYILLSEILSSINPIKPQNRSPMVPYMKYIHASSKTGQKYFSVFYDKGQTILYMHKVFIVRFK